MVIGFCYFCFVFLLVCFFFFFLFVALLAAGGRERGRHAGAGERVVSTTRKVGLTRGVRKLEVASRTADPRRQYSSEHLPRRTYNPRRQRKRNKNTGPPTMVGRCSEEQTKKL